MCNYVMRRTHAETKKEVGANPWWYNNPAVLQAVNALSAFLLSQSPPLILSLVGRHEHLTTDLDQHLGDYGLTLEDDFNHYEAGHTEYDNLPPQMQSYANIINSIKLSRSIIPGGPSRLHIAGAVTQNAKNVLKNKTIFGRTIWLSRNTNIIAYANGLPCCYNMHSGKSVPSGLIFEVVPAATYGFKFMPAISLAHNNIIEYQKLWFGAWSDDCCTGERDIFGICTNNWCSQAPSPGIVGGISPIAKVPDMVIGSNPPATGDSDLWKTIVEQAYDTALLFINNNTEGGTSAWPAYTINGTSCIFDDLPHS
jgi:hypothetical protein